MCPHVFHKDPRVFSDMFLVKSSSNLLSATVGLITDTDVLYDYGHHIAREMCMSAPTSRGHLTATSK